MRYYKIVIEGGSVGPTGDGTITSHPNGTGSPPDPGALQVEMDVFSYPQAATDTNSWIRVWGISLQDISQARDLSGKNVTLYGGMGKGLPLANPAQAGLLVSGQINQAYGNWIGVNMTLDLQLRAGGPPQPGPGDVNLTLDWKKGQKLSDVVQQTLKKAFPNATINVNINQNLTLNHDEQGVYHTLPQFADYVSEVSQDIVNPSSVYKSTAGDYPGVQINVAPDSSINVYDGTNQSGVKEISFTDLIGQVTWIEPGTVQATCVMRSDIRVGDMVKMPPGQVTVTTAAQSQFSQLRQDSVFQGTFMVSQVRHVGNYKQASAEAWVTVLNCQLVSTGGSANAPTPGAGASASSGTTTPSNLPL